MSVPRLDGGEELAWAQAPEADLARATAGPLSRVARRSTADGSTSAGHNHSPIYRPSRRHLSLSQNSQKPISLISQHLSTHSPSNPPSTPVLWNWKLAANKPGRKNCRFPLPIVSIGLKKELVIECPEEHRN